ncbi:hypothetical protein [Pseudomonas chlororaphis]|uniref:hypothetical protein n=1 Tax=Pseudomonas chlororaphis TaxID=587753 RepID=UPI00117A5B8F|nr:hypothetical protein [Pseudomonas chlororaphis]
MSKSTLEVTDSEFLEIERKLGSMVARYTTAIHRIAPDDNREPPGDLHGTGNFIQIEKLKYLLTCEHVTEFLKHGDLCIALQNAGAVFTLVNPVSALLDPADIAIIGISDNDWGSETHDHKCIQLDQLAERHSPVVGEWMYISGYPGELAHAWPPMLDGSGCAQEPGQQHFTAISFMCQVEEAFDDALSKEHPAPLKDMHFLLPYSPEIVEYMSDGPEKVLPLPPGLSGSLVWNTRYVEITSSGQVWKPEDARITGIVWGGSSKFGVLVATPAEYIWQLIGLALDNIKANRPYWKSVDENTSPKLNS